MIAQRYGIGGKPWTSAPAATASSPGSCATISRRSAGRTARERAWTLNERSADAFYSIGAPYVALASDWLPARRTGRASCPWPSRRNFGNLA